MDDADQVEMSSSSYKGYQPVSVRIPAYLKPNGEQLPQRNPRKNNTGRQSFGSVLLQFGENTTFHGPRNIVEAQPFIWRR